MIAAVKREVKEEWINRVGANNQHYKNATNFTPPNREKYDNISRKDEHILSQLHTGKSPYNEIFT